VFTELRLAVADWNLLKIHTSSQAGVRPLSRRYRRSLARRNDTLLNAVFISDRITPRRTGVFVRVVIESRHAQKIVI